ncbi:hypothetical protein [Wolbachia endosymbiont of Pentidionis agamae]
MYIINASLLYDIYYKFLNNPDSLIEDEKRIVESTKEFEPSIK